MTSYSITDLINPNKMIKGKVDSLNEKASSKDSGKTEKLVAEFSKVFIPLNFEMNWSFKFIYPFKSPALVIICFL